MDTVFEKTARLLAGIIGTEPEDMKPGMELSPKSGVEPVDVARLVIDCERKFKIKIWDEDVHRLRTLGDFTEYIRRRMDERDVGLAKEAERTDWHYR